ncbi:MAG: DNA repair protein RecO [Gemmatimonadales bacterium]|nr:DNA repair protein RecO [Gemmatimonadales bacterium]
MSLLPKPTVEADAWVLRVWPCGETSIIASLLTRKYGYVRVVAKGARGARSRLRPLVEPGRLVNVEFSWDPDRELQYLRSGSVLMDSLSGSPTLEGTTFLLAALELADRCRPILGSRDDRTAGEVFAVCEEFLRVLSSDACGDPALLFFAFEWELLQRHGMAPEVAFCVSCGESPADKAESVTWFSPSDGGLVCGGCAHLGEGSRGNPLGPEALACLRRLSSCGLDIPVEQPMARSLRRQIGGHLHRFLGYHLPGYRLPSALELLRVGKESSR